MANERMFTLDKIREFWDLIKAYADTKISPSQKGKAGGVAELDANGKVPASQLDLSGKKDIQIPVISPTASGSGAAFIDSVSQNAQGVISATKKNVYGSGIPMSSSDAETVGNAVRAIRDWKPSGNGTSGQYLRSNGNGTTEWADPATSQEITDAVDDWMNDHIQPNTTVALDDTLTSTTAAAQAAAAGAIVIVSDTEPSANTNQLWVDPTSDDEVQVPTYEEYSVLNSAFNALGLSIVGGKICIAFEEETA